MILIAASLAILGQRALDVSQASLVSSTNLIVPGKAFDVGIFFKLKPGWHVYWRNPGDAGQEIRVAWSLPKGWKVSPLTWPAPKVVDENGVVSFCYSDSVLLKATITPGAARGRVLADVSWLVCNETCIPGSQRLVLKLKSANTSMFANLAAPRRIPDSHASAILTGKQLTLTLHGESLPTGARFLPFDRGVIDYSAPTSFAPVEMLQVCDMKVSPYFDLKKTPRLRGVISQYNGGNPAKDPRPLEVDVPIQIGKGEAR